MKLHNPLRFLTRRVCARLARLGTHVTAAHERPLNQHGRRPKNLLVALGVTLMCISVLSTPSWAGDNKVYPGGNCKSVDGDPDLFYYSSTWNLSAVDTELIVCPVVRDVTGGGTPKAYVYVNNNGVSCFLRATNQNGGAGVSATAAPAFVAAGVYLIDIQGLPPADPQGAYYITCTLPPGTSVLRYSLAE